MKITEESMKRQQALENGEPVEPEALPPAPEPQLSEREKLKQMNRKDKLWYIWSYYKFHMMAAVIVVFLIYAVASTVYRSSFTTALYCMCINSRTEAEMDFTPLEEDFAAWLDLGSKETITTETSFISYGDAATDYSYASMAKITALVSAKDLDIMLCDSETLNHYASLSAYLDLEASLPPELLALVSDRLFYTTGADGVARAYAIDLSGTEFAEAVGLAQQPPLLSIISNSERTDNVFALLRYIFDPQA